MTADEVIEFLEDKLGKESEEIILADGLDRAFIGASLEPPRAVYSIELCINALTNQGLSTSEAEDQFWGSVVTVAEDCESAPIFIHTLI